LDWAAYSHQSGKAAHTEKRNIITSTDQEGQGGFIRGSTAATSVHSRF